MTQPGDDFTQSNITRLLQAGLGDEARLDPTLKKAMHHRLVRELRSEKASSAFPIKILAALSALGGLVALWVLAKVGEIDMNITGSERWLMLALPLLTNILLSPVASLVIIIKRRNL